MIKQLILAGAVVLLAGCGGGDDPPVVPESRSVPTSATASPMAYADFVGTRPVEDALEPLVVQGVVPPTTDEDEPVPLR